MSENLASAAILLASLRFIVGCYMRRINAKTASKIAR